MTVSSLKIFGIFHTGDLLFFRQEVQGPLTTKPF